MAKRPPKRTYYQRSEDYAKQVSSEIIEQIKKGTAPWQKPWKPGEQSSPSNLATGKAYTGGNSLYLMSRQISEGRGDNRWGTYRQIEALGGQVRRGEKGTQVLFYQNRTEQPAKDEEGKIRKDKDGKTIYEEAENVRPVMRQYTVFNVEQTDGLKLPPRESPTTPEWDTHREADKVLRASGAKVQHVPGGDRAFYSPTEDKIVLPDPSQFASRNGYYQTALHEAGHSTGHHDRMNRDTLKDGMEKGFGSPEYAREELRAEISAMMTGEQVGVGHDPQRGAAYVENWVKVLEDDPHEIRRAAGDAQKMTNHLMERAITQEREHPTKTKAELTQEFSHARGPQIGQTPKQPVAARTQTQERDVAEIGMYRTVAYKDLSEAHFDGHPYATRRAVDRMIQQGDVEEHTARGPQGGTYKVLTLTGKGVHRAEVAARAGGLEGGQKAWSGLVKSAELQHDTAVFRAARIEQGKLIEKGAVLRRVRIDAELKREVARASETARMKGGKEAADAARVEKAAELGLPVKAGKVEYPDAQLEYDLDGRSGRVNVEIATEHYSTKSIGAKAAAGFAVHGSNGRAAGRVARALGRDDGNSGGGGGKDRDPASFEL